MKSVFFGIVLALFASLALGGEGRAAEIDDATNGEIEITPALTGVYVDGDDNKFREDWWVREGVNGGIENFRLTRDLGDGTIFEARGRAIVPEEDYRLDLLVRKPDFGFVRAGYSEYRKYYDDTGGFFRPFVNSSFDLGKDLHLDIGRVFIEAGLTMPQMPQLVVGYEHRFKNGEKSLLEWGSVTEGGITRKLFPSFKEIDEKLDIVRVEISHEIANVRLGNEFRYEYYRIDTKRHEREVNIDTGGGETVEVDEDYEHDAFINTFHVESHLNDKTFWSLGYLFTSLDGEASFRMRTTPFVSNFDKNWFSNSIDLDQDVHIVNANVIMGPFRQFTIYAGLEGESSDTEGDTDAILNEISGGAEVSPEAVIDSDKDKWSLEETVGIRYTGLPRTTIYAEGRWTQQDIELTETEIEDGDLEIDRDTDTRVRRQRYSIGFNSSPLPRTTIAARYRYSRRSNDYDHEPPTPGNYPSFILDQDIQTDEVMAKISFQPMARIRTSLQYQLVSMDIDTDEDTETTPTSVRTTNYDAHIYTATVTATPYAGLFLTGLVSYQDVHLETVDLADAPVKSYEGDVLSLSASAGLALDSRTDLHLQYIYSLAENFENFSDVGFPLGVENQRHAVLSNLTRRITDNVSVKLRYGYYYFDDDASDGSDDYKAHLVGAVCKVIF
jgi:hypothetical protein